MPPLRRNQRPLFDLIGQIPTGAQPSSGSVPTHTPSAGSMIESTPTSPVSKGKLSSHAPGDEVASFDRYASTARNSGGLTVSINSLYLAGAALVVVALLVWVGGYFYGMRSKQKELEPVLRQSVIPSGGDPLANNTTSSPPAGLGTSTNPSYEASLNLKAAPGSAVTTINDPKAIISVKGLLASDPREPGLNYLHIERLPAGDAEKVIAFLTRSGVETIGVPVESSKKAANNVPLYSVVALRGITGEQYRQKDKARSGLESEVVRLGTIWQREYKGTTNFTRSNWMKYQP